MRVNTGVSRCAGQVLVLPVGYVLVRVDVPVLLGQAKVDDVDQVALLTQPHQEVVGLDVPMDKVFVMYIFNTADLRAEKKEREGYKSLSRIPRHVNLRDFLKCGPLP